MSDHTPKNDEESQAWFVVGGSEDDPQSPNTSPHDSVEPVATVVLPRELRGHAAEDAGSADTVPASGQSVETGEVAEKPEAATPPEPVPVSIPACEPQESSGPAEGQVQPLVDPPSSPPVVSREEAPLPPPSVEVETPVSEVSAPAATNWWETPGPEPSAAAAGSEPEASTPAPLPLAAPVSEPAPLPPSEQPFQPTPVSAGSIPPSLEPPVAHAPEPPTQPVPPRAHWWERQAAATPVNPAPPPPPPTPDPVSAPHAEDPPPPSPPAAGHGFRPAEVIRLGGTGVRVPNTQVGLLVTVRTPQRIRLGQVTILKEARSTIGSGRVACFVDDPGAADFHAVIACQEAGGRSAFCLHSVESAPIHLNGTIPAPMTPLQSGDHLVIGSTELVFFEAALTQGESI